MDGKPFYFDEHIFDDDTLSGMSDEEQVALPQFTQDEMDAERKNSFQSGVDAGKKEALEGVEQKTLSVLEKIHRDISFLFASEDDRNRQYELDAVLLTLEILKKTFPALMKERGHAVIEKALSQVLSQYKIPEKVEISAPSDTVSHMKTYIEKMEGTLQKSIRLVSHDNSKDSECHIFWPEGGIILNHRDIVDKSFALITETLAENGVKVHDESENTDRAAQTENQEN